MFKTDTPSRTSQFYTTLQPMKPRSSCVVLSLLQKKTRSCGSPEDEVFDLEESFSYGKTRDRRELREDPEIPAPSKEPNTVYECVSKGILNMGKAAAIICRLRGEGKFNNAAYKEFLHSDTAYRSKPDFEDLDRDQDNWWRYNPIALQRWLARTTSYSDKDKINYATSTVFVDLNCSDVWAIEVSAFQTRHDKGCGRQVASQKKGHKFSKAVVSLQIFARKGFGLDLLGFGRKEIVDEATNVQESAFYINLGSSESGRREALEKLRCQKREWSAYVFKALQKSLRDIRSYTFDASRGWIPSTRQAKKSRAENDYVPCTQSPESGLYS